MRRSQFGIAMYVLLIFVSGIAVGGFAYHLYTVKTVRATTERRKTPDDFRRDYLSEMKTRLQLTEQQTANLNTILDRTREEYKEFHDRTRPEMQSIQQRQIDGVKAMLNPTQQAEYDKMRAERETRRKEREKLGKPR